jgi:hypothetical protein
MIGGAGRAFNHANVRFEVLTHRAEEENVASVLSSDDRQTCADCGQQPPATETNYTLISARHGWRLSRAIAPSGVKVMKWRCPECWRKYRTGK